MKWLLAIGLVLSFAVHADAVDEMGGATQKEREIRWLWKYTGEFVRSCVKSGVECKDPEIREVVESLVKSFPPEPQAASSAWGQRLHFVSEKDNPDLFKAGNIEAHRVAMTEMKAGAAVSINSDRMENFEASQWVGILVHETVHHLGIDDDARRLPDRVGAAVAAHVKANWQVTTMAEFGHPEAEVVSFSDPAQDRPARILIHALMFSIDNNATPNARVKICAGGEKFKGQTIAAALWRVRQLRGDKKLARVSASAHVHSACIDAAGNTRQVINNFSLYVDLKFTETFALNGAWWEKASQLDPTSLRAGINDAEDELLDTNRTFVVRSLTNDKPSYQAGDQWHSHLVVESTDGFSPTECTAFFSGSQWFFDRQVNTTMFEGYENCQVSPLNGNQFQVDLSYTFPKNAQPDSFSLAFVHFPSANATRFAIPSRPQFVQLLNAAAAPALRVTAWRVLGLQERKSIMGKPTLNSYAANYGQPFWLEVDVQGIQKLKRQFFDFDFLVEYNGSVVLMAANPPVEGYPAFLKTETVPIPGGTRLRYQMQMPSTLLGVTPLGFKLRRVDLEADDFGWAELEMPNFLEGLFLTDKISP